VTSWAIDDGTLAISSDGNLGNVSGALSFDGGTLQFTAGINTSRAITLNQGGGTFDTDGNNVTLTGLISGSGELIKFGAGTLALSHANTYSGGTALDAGTLDVAALGAAGSGAITFAHGSETLKIENAALANHNFGNAIVDFNKSDVIDLTGLAFAPGTTASYNARTGILTVTTHSVADTLTHGITDTLTLVHPAGHSFEVVNDGNGGTAILLRAHAVLDGDSGQEISTSVVGVAAQSDHLMI
jgi:autotransporter-associated beta strand protein